MDATGGIAASDINDLDQIIGTYFVAEDSTVHGFIFDDDDYLTLDSTLGDDGTTELLGMNNIGQIVGTYVDRGAEHAFVYDAINGFAELDLLRPEPLATTSSRSTSTTSARSSAPMSVGTASATASS